MEKRQQQDELTNEELEKIRGGARMAQAPAGQPGSGGSRKWYEGNLEGDIHDSPGGPTIGDVTPLDDPPHFVE